MPRSLRPATTAERMDISSVTAPKLLLVMKHPWLLEEANVEENLVHPVRRNHLVLATTVIKKDILRAIVPTKPSNSPKDPELVVVPVEAATEDALKLVTDVELKTIWLRIVPSPT